MRSRSAGLSVYCRTIARSSEAHAQNGASCSSERRRRRATGCPFKLPGFQAPSAEGVQVGQRAALYCRVSTADQSCDRQERDLRAFAKRSGFEIAGVYKEKASGAKTDRIERKKVMALAQAREIEAILVTELSRWGRSTIDLVQTLQSLQAWDVSVLAISGLQFDLSAPHGKMIASVSARRVRARSYPRAHQVRH